jgi:hypothetical protein
VSAAVVARTPPLPPAKPAAPALADTAKVRESPHTRLEVSMLVETGWNRAFCV